ncbi:hypothetical protein [Thauera propionica]|uniref:hypothetical protein n=1 Tax=Thauera propionica TaxID=2019431 RepID=UPI0023EF5807|nr:hypothetical protein [Thauera propionica]
MYVQLAIYAVVAFVGFWVGDRVSSGRHEARLADVAVAISESQNAATERANQALDAERKRADAAQKSRGAQRALAQGVTHEIARDADLSCEWRDAHRLRVEQLYHAYGYAPDGSPAGVQDSLHAAAVHRDAEGAVGGGGVQLGRGLRSPAP